MTPQFSQLADWLGTYGVSLVVSLPDEREEDFLFPEEANLAAKMQEKRKREFLTGRRAARQALLLSGGEVSPIPQGRRGEPLWPPGFRGSITHTKGLLAAACLREAEQFSAVGMAVQQKKAQSVGLDLERVDRVISEAAWQHILSANEVHTHAAVTDPVQRLVLFSAKESLYKALYPLCGEFFGCTDAELEWLQVQPRGYPQNGLARLALRRSLGLETGGERVFSSGQKFDCHWQIDSDWLLTALIVEPFFPDNALADQQGGAV